MTLQRLATLAAATLFLAAVTGCKRSEPAAEGPVDAAPKLVIYLAPSTDRPFDLGQKQFLMQAVAGQSRAELEIMDAKGNATVQRGHLEQALKRKPFAIIINPLSPAELEAGLKQALAERVLVIALDFGSGDVPCTSRLICGQREIGTLAGKLVVKALTAKAREEGRADVTGRVVEIRGDEQAVICAQRHEGFAEAIKEAPGIILVHDAPGNWTRAGGRARTEEALRVQRQFDVVFAHNDAMALGAAEAAGDLRESTFIVGVDGFNAPEGGYLLVNNGDIDASIFQPLMVDFAWIIIRRKIAKPELELQPTYELAPQAITPRDIERIRREGLAPFPTI